jgi:hypothetical protein
MPLPLQSRSSGTRVQEISRQFTAPERAVDDRITSHLTAPMPQVSGIDAATGYKWLEDDLKFRSQITSQLNQERDLANAQSVRQELDRQFTQDSQDDVVAIGAMQQINDLLAKNPDKGLKWAMSQHAQTNPSILTNKKFVDMGGKALSMFESDADIASRNLAREAQDIHNTVSKMGDEDRMEWMRENPDATKKLMQMDYNSKLLDLDAGTVVKQAAKVKAEQDIRETNENLAKIKAFGPDGSLDAEAGIQAALGSGVPITDVKSTMTALSGSPAAQAMLAHPTWARETLAPEEQAALGQALDVYANAALPAEERATAKALIVASIGRYSRDTSEASRSVVEREKLLSFGADLGKSYKEVVDAFKGFNEPVKGNGSQMKVPDNGDQAIGFAEDWITQANLAIGVPIAELANITASLEAAKTEKDQAAKRKAAAQAARDFVGVAQKFKAKPMTTTSRTSGSPSDFSKLSEEEARKRVGALKSGDRFIAPDGKTYAKP